VLPARLSSSHAANGAEARHAVNSETGRGGGNNISKRLADGRQEGHIKETTACGRRYYGMPN
jgi:hypothetical protein